MISPPPANFWPVLVLTKPAQCRPSTQPAPRQSLLISACALAEGRINHDVIWISLELARFDVAQFHLPYPAVSDPSGITLTRRTIRRTMRSSRAGDRLCLGFETQSSHSPWHVSCLRYTGELHLYLQPAPILDIFMAEVDEFDDRVMFGEIYAPLADLMKYYGALVKLWYTPT